MICEKERCTGCGMCTAVCPKQCITLQQNEFGSLKYHVDEERCIHCGKCEKMCPQNSQGNGCPPRKCYAAWAADPSERASSSSGGIASALYRRILREGGAAVGACYVDGEFRLKLTEKEEDIRLFKGSKYVNCHSKDIYAPVKEKIAEGKPVLFIGTPCQVAAIKQVIGDSGLLYTVDLICHGTPPQSYFAEHFKAMKENMVAADFRDGGVYRLRIDCSEGNAYRIDGGLDEYYLAFINGITFNDCCYVCRYAKLERVSDITIGDFWGIDEAVGRREKVDRISLLLCNTEQGEKLLRNASDICLIERDIAEALPKNEQLTRPFKRGADREKFESCYPKFGFDRSIHKLKIEKTRKKNRILTQMLQLKRKLNRSK